MNTLILKFTSEDVLSVDWNRVVLHPRLKNRINFIFNKKCKIHMEWSGIGVFKQKTLLKKKYIIYNERDDYCSLKTTMNIEFPDTKTLAVYKLMYEQ